MEFPTIIYNRYHHLPHVIFISLKPIKCNQDIFNLKCIFNKTNLHLSETGITIDRYELIGNLLEKFQCRSQMFTFIQTNKNVYNKKHVDR